MKISYSQIESSCNELHAVAKNMQSSFEKISAIKTTVNGGSFWGNEAASAYAQSLEVLTSQFDDIFLEIESSILYLASCAEGYQAVDNLVMTEICNSLGISDPAGATTSQNNSSVVN